MKSIVAIEVLVSLATTCRLACVANLMKENKLQPPKAVETLPKEVLCHIANALGRQRYINYLVRTSPRLYVALNPLLYWLNRRRDEYSAPLWSTNQQLQPPKTIEALPAELLFQVADAVDNERYINYLVRASPRLYVALNPFLYWINRKRDEYSALLWSVNHDSMGTTLAAFAAGAHVETRSKNSRSVTALHIACRNGNQAMAELLLRRGADIEAENSGEYTPLQYAIAFEKESLAVVLIEQGADILHRKLDHTCGTMLHLAAAGGCWRTAEALLARGMAIDILDWETRTPLHHAARSTGSGPCQNRSSSTTFFQTLRVLLEHGANPDSKDLHAVTPRSLIQKERNSTIKKVLSPGFAIMLYEASSYEGGLWTQLALELDTRVGKWRQQHWEKCARQALRETKRDTEPHQVFDPQEVVEGTTEEIWALIDARREEAWKWDQSLALADMEEDQESVQRERCEYRNRRSYDTHKDWDQYSNTRSSLDGEFTFPFTVEQCAIQKAFDMYKFFEPREEAEARRLESAKSAEQVRKEKDVAWAQCEMRQRWAATHQRVMREETDQWEGVEDVRGLFGEDIRELFGDNE